MKKIKQGRNSGVSLIELLLAISLLVVVMLAVSSVDIASKKHLREVDIRTTLYSEVNFAMERIVKSVSQAVGQYSDAAICVRTSIGTECAADMGLAQTGNTVSFRFPDATFSNLSDNDWGAYRYNTATYEIWGWEYTGGAWAYKGPISRPKISTVVFRRGAGANSNSLQILIGAKQDPGAAFDPITNPEIISESNVVISGMSTN